MSIAYVLVQCEIGYEMKILKELLSLHFVKESKGTFGFYDILVKIEDQSEKKIEMTVVTKGPNPLAIGYTLVRSPI